MFLHFLLPFKDKKRIYWSKYCRSSFLFLFLLLFLQNNKIKVKWKLARQLLQPLCYVQIRFFFILFFFFGLKNKKKKRASEKKVIHFFKTIKNCVKIHRQKLIKLNSFKKKRTTLQILPLIDSKYPKSIQLNKFLSFSLM